MEERKAIDALKKIKKIFDKHEIEFWLNMGTLLGAIRDKRIIPWDDDIDLGTYYKNVDKIILVSEDLRKKGFELYIYNNKMGIKLFNKDCKIGMGVYPMDSGDLIESTTFIHGDIILGQILDYLHWTLIIQSAHLIDSRMPLFITKILIKFGQLQPEWLKKIINKKLQLLYKKYGSVCIYSAVPSHFFKKLSTINFYGMKFKVPSDPEGYLAYRYGMDWKVPKKEYVYYKDDGAIKDIK